TEFHAVRLLERKVNHESGHIACLSWAGHDEAESAAWRVQSLANGRWELNHDQLGTWLIEDESLPELV
ncbi:MAG: hypothetical protein P8L44_10020, partial [Opitutales bacterium]|nr:hypothetical protein [Opitutales bacterium]